MLALTGLRGAGGGGCRSLDDCTCREPLRVSRAAVCGEEGGAWAVHAPRIGPRGGRRGAAGASPSRGRRGRRPVRWPSWSGISACSPCRTLDDGLRASGWLAAIAPRDPRDGPGDSRHVLGGWLRANPREIAWGPTDGVQFYEETIRCEVGWWEMGESPARRSKDPWTANCGRMSGTT